MLKRLLALVFIVSAFGLAPLAAQSPTDPTALVPATFAAFIEVRDQPSSADGVRQTLAWTDETRINQVMAVRFAPLRLDDIGTSLNIDSLINLATLLDVPNASFRQHVLGWLDNPFVIAYRAVGVGLSSQAQDQLLILPTDDSLAVLSGLSAFSDGFKVNDYNGVGLYQKGKAAFALTDSGLLLGSAETVQAALDVQAGTAPALIDSLAYRAVRRDSHADYYAFAYAQGEAVPLLASGLLSDDADSAALYAGLGAALADGRTPAGFEGALWSGAFDGVGATIHMQDRDNAWIGRAVFHLAAGMMPASNAPDADLLASIPSNAFLVTAGGDFSAFAGDTLRALPLTTFARQLYSGLPIFLAGTANETLSVPDVATIRFAADSFAASLQTFSQIDLQAAVIDPASGAYALGFLPRPNNPLVVLGIPFDAVLLLKPADPTAALNGFKGLLIVIFGVEELDSRTLGEVEWTQLGVGAEVAFSLGISADRLIITTGADAPAAVLTGETLANLSTWEALNANAPASLYADMDMLVNSFYTGSDGFSTSSTSHTRAALSSAVLSENTFAVTLKVLLPTN